MNITPEITKAIESQLPAAISSIIVERLSQVSSLESQLAEARRDRDAVHERNKQLSARESEVSIQHGTQLAKQGELTLREAELVKREAKCALNEVRLEMTQARITDLKEVTLAVFANSKLKYFESYSHPVAVPSSGGYVQNHSGSKTVETQG